VSSGHVVMVLTGALGVLLTFTAIRAASHADAVVVAARELAPGAVVGAGDVTVGHIHASNRILAGLVRDPRAVVGSVVTRAVAAGALVLRSDVRDARADAATRVMSFPVARSRAVGGKLVPGDRVDVFAVARNTGESGYVVVDADVVGVDAHGGGPLAGADDDVTVSIAVDGASAARMAVAVESGTVTLVRATGATPLHDIAMFGAK